jgi:hypothetical protein
MIGLGLGMNVSGAGAPLNPYRVNGFTPGFVYSPKRNVRRVGGINVPYASFVTTPNAASSNRTVTDSDGVLKWVAHNLLLNSGTPATQSITVVVGQVITVEATGAGTINLTGAGSGAVTSGSPVTITATTTTLTLTKVGALDLMWAYRSDLGGMQNNPVTGDSYVATGSQAVYMDRTNNYIRKDGAWVGPLHLVEPERTQLFHTTNALVTQSVTLAAVAHTVHFTGTGTITLTGASTAGPLVGTGTGEENRVSLTFTPSAGSVTFTVSGTVTNADLTVGATQSSHIPNTAGSGTVTRTADNAPTIAGADMPWPEVEYIGAELVTNGGFVTDSDWTKGGGWIIADGVASHSTTSGDIYQSLSCVIGKVYEARITADTTGTTPMLNSPVQIRNSANSFSIVSFVLVANTVNNVVLRFVATETTHIIRVYSNFSYVYTLDNISVREIKPLAVSIVFEGYMTYADEDVSIDVRPIEWAATTTSRIVLFQDADRGTGGITFYQETPAEVSRVETGGSVLSPGVNVPLNIAASFAPNEVKAAINGTLQTATSRTGGLPDLSGTDFVIAHTGILNISEVLVFAGDIGDVGIAAGSAT